MNERRISFGPGAASLILVVVTLCLSLLGLLSLSNARGDLALSQASAAVSEEVYAGMAGAEKTLAYLDEILMECAEKAQSDEEYLTLVQGAVTGANRTLSYLTDSVLAYAERTMNGEGEQEQVVGLIPEALEMEGRLVRLKQNAEDRSLYGTVEINTWGEFPRLIWREHRTIVEGEIWN